MKNYEYHNVGGYVFKVYLNNPKPFGTDVFSKMTITDVYKRPSSAKQYHYQKWCEWFEKMHGMDYGVYSYNCHTFTMVGRIFWNERWYKVYISKARQEMMPM